MVKNRIWFGRLTTYIFHYSVGKGVRPTVLKWIANTDIFIFFQSKGCSVVVNPCRSTNEFRGLWCRGLIFQIVHQVLRTTVIQRPKRWIILTIATIIARNIDYPGHSCFVCIHCFVESVPIPNVNDSQWCNYILQIRQFVNLLNPHNFTNFLCIKITKGNHACMS